MDESYDVIVVYAMGPLFMAACGDLNLDGYLDIYVVNGAGTLEDGEAWRRFVEDPARLFVADGTGGFAEQAELLGVADLGIGRGKQRRGEHLEVRKDTLRL